MFVVDVKLNSGNNLNLDGLNVVKGMIRAPKVEFPYD